MTNQKNSFVIFVVCHLFMNYFLLNKANKYIHCYLKQYFRLVIEIKNSKILPFDDIKIIGQTEKLNRNVKRITIS